MREITDLLFPRACAGCGDWDFNLCPSCGLHLDAEPQLGAVEDNVGNPALPVYSLGKYGGALRQTIISAKHQPGRDLTNYLYQAGANLSQPVAALLLPARFVWVVGAPSSWRRRWDRAEVTKAVATGVVDGLTVLLPDVNVQEVAPLRLRVGSGSQSAKSGDARRRGRHGAFVLSAKPPPGTAVILVDDVLTTGATILEMWRLLGDSVQAAVVLATA